MAMRYVPPGSAEFIEHRRRLAARLLPNSMAIVVANDILPTNADGTLPFKQNSDLFYLTGIGQEETILVLYPEAFDQEKHRELLFVRETNEQVTLWEGNKLTKEAASKLTGIAEANIHWTHQFDGLLRQLMIQADHVYLNLNEHTRAAVTIQTRETRFAHECREKFPLHHYERLAPHLAALRTKKSPAEIALIKEACEITAAGFRRILGFVKPGVGEWEIEAELAHEFLRRRSRGFAYEPIIGGGRSACVLHYVANDAVCRDGEMLLLDVGAEYANYNADLTRTIPVNGRFTKRQRKVYSAVLRVFRASCDFLRPGVLTKDWTKHAGELMEKELVDLKLLKMKEIKKQDPEKPAYKKFFPHGLGHHLGLDVHDVGALAQPVAVGNVFTVEPGIYLPEENLGIRLENDVVVGKAKNTDLMASIPIEIDEIEELMNARSGQRAAQPAR
jgi:Xaa-Pro aminopeptidase